jgi:NADH dehydrogenase
MLPRLEQGSLATVFGGSGFIGSQIVRALAGNRWRVRAAVRRPDLAGRLQPMGAVGQIHAVQANVRFPDSLPAAVDGALAVINAVGILAPGGAQTFAAIHVDGARAIARAARAAGARHFVHISAIGANPKSPALYGRTKAAGEQAVLEEFPNAVIIRPSIVFGPEDQFFNRFAAMARVSPFLPLIGGGRTKFQPVFVGDVASAVAAAAESHAQPGTIYEAGGPEILTFRQILDRTQTWAGRYRPYVHLPFWAAKLLGLLTAPLPGSLQPLTLDQVRLLQIDNVVGAAAKEERRTLEALGVSAPQNVAAIVPGYLERFRPRGQFSRYRG